MKPIIVETIGGKASMTKEDLEQIIKDSYEEGFNDGQRSMTPITSYPTYPNIPANPVNPVWPNTPTTPNWPNPWEPTVTYCKEGK